MRPAHLLPFAALWLGASSGVHAQAPSKADRAIAVVLAAGKGAKANGHPLNRGDLIMPDERVITGKGWLHLMTKSWGFCPLRSHMSWPPLNGPPQSTGFVQLFQQVIALFRRENAAVEAGTRSPDRAESFDLIEIGVETGHPERPDSRSIWLAYAVRHGLGDRVRFTYDRGVKLTHAPPVLLGSIARFDLYRCDIALPGTHTSEGKLSMTGTKRRISAPPFSLTTTEIAPDQRRTLGPILRASQSADSSASLLGFGNLFEAWSPGSDVDDFFAFPVAAFDAYFRAYRKANLPQDRRNAALALYEELSRLDCPLATLFEPKP